MKKEVIEKRRHSKGCRIKDQYWPEGEVFFANFAGNNPPGGMHSWLPMRCNDPDCEFLAVVSTGALSNLVATKLGFKR